MNQQPEYTFERDGTIWCVLRWRKSENSNGFTGEKVNTFILKEEARKEVFRLNRWIDYRLNFSYNWNSKLNGKAFTSIRLWNDRKYTIGMGYDIYLNDIFRGRAVLLSIKRIKLESINEHIARLDTGYSANECRELIRKMYKNKRMDWSSQYLAYLLFTFDDGKRGLFNSQINDNDGL
ncbi:ASCH domain-containing protein [Limibacterium fermenti]|uniref:ASCH domain-containing protein n=1 Tax=Limibacterium fermenti TaxID=3229863 RepID=UPI000E917B0C|nr:hypothetical protein [Porphyromonadaceae bacterium]